MGHSHADHQSDGAPAPTPVRLILALALLPFALATLVSLVVLWPRDPLPPRQDPNALAISDNVDATVTRVDSKTCLGAGVCHAVTVHLDSGPDTGADQALPDMSLADGVAPLAVGDKVVVQRVEVLLTGDVSYSFRDYQRTQPMWLLAALFAVIVVGVARWKGVAALVGLGFTYLVLVGFVIPAIMRNESPIGVALAGSALIMFVVLYLAHGFNARTSTALLGTLVSLSITGALAWLFISLTRLTGTASEEVMFLQSAGARLNLSGLLLGGIIIGSLGVLNDVTVTQASAVWEIHRANPAEPVTGLYRAGMRVGRDHIASVVDTLVLAYAGATLPLMILFILGNQRLGDVVTSEIVAEEIVRTLVGSIGLVASVPVTTFVACLVVSRTGVAPVADAAGPRVRRASGEAVTRLRSAARNAADDTRARTEARAEVRAEDRRKAKQDKAETWEPPRHERAFWDEH